MVLDGGNVGCISSKIIMRLYMVYSTKEFITITCTYKLSYVVVKAFPVIECSGRVKDYKNHAHALCIIISCFVKVKKIVIRSGRG